MRSVPPGSVESLRRSYKSGIDGLMQDYRAYLNRNIQETVAPAPRKPKTRTAGGPRQTNMTCRGTHLLNDSRIHASISSDSSNDTNTPSSTVNISRSCNTHGLSEDFGLNVSEGSDETAESRKTLNTSTGHSRDEDISVSGLLIIEPLKNVSHNVRHHPCESPAIQQALVTRIINAQDMERNRNFFRYQDKVFYGLLRQRDDFVLRTD